MIKVAYHPIYVHPVPENHRFPMEKYELLAYQLQHENIIPSECFFEPQAIDEQTILHTHQSTYWNKLKNLELSPREQRVSGFKHNQELILREQIITQGTLDAAYHALEHGAAFNIAGGTHHAFTDRAEGFCLLNDFAVAANQLLLEKTVKNVLIVDLDVHQGNGTAEIFINNDAVFTFSMHGEHNYPLHKEKSDLDIPLKTGIQDEEYLSILTSAISDILNRFKPEIIFYQSGVDILATDKLGHLSLTIDGCKRRDQIVIETAHNMGIPICIAMGGGYSKDIKVILEAHSNTFRIASHLYI